MSTFLQINLNCCKAAQALALQQAAESNVDLLIVSEPCPTKVDAWYYDAHGKAAIACLRGLPVDIVGPTEPGFTWIQAGTLRIYSCYWSPRSDPNLAQYSAFLSNLEHSIRSHSGDSLICGDFNAHHSAWGSCSNNKKGDALMDLIQSLGLIICNTGTTPTFQRASGSSVIDITLASPRVASRISNWSVLDTVTLSDHSYIQFTLLSAPIKPVNATYSRRLHAPALASFLSTGQLLHFSNSTDVDEMAINLNSALYAVCGLPLADNKGKRRSVHWWSPSLSALRKTANHLRRVFQRKRRRLGAAACTDEELAAKSAKLALVKAIRNAKDQAWRQLCDDVERDPWGKPYKIVMGRMNVRTPIPGLNLPGRLPAIIQHLFPSHQINHLNTFCPSLSTPARKIDLEELKSASGWGGKVGGSLLARSKCPKGRTTLTENPSTPNSSWGSLGTEVGTCPRGPCGAPGAPHSI
ncbi:uncharacterized protein LOC132951423 [Metopolophium dirhodum]|uniref:uncharacterized protein LOC132942672 n=1 Tax=Metopolophium dirhodum TaxID=44670 RepID=UPI0029901142|nr:uncharacterized protein LOC132942672 [Metopolophium dirhodum]XP_060879211.1 uncharacterized protein LOC132951423 [Metopolophium dirhodum]